MEEILPMIKRGKYEILILRTLNAAFATYKGDKNMMIGKNLKKYCGRFWFSNGNHHHYGNEKFIPACSFEYFSSVIKGSDSTQLPKGCRRKH
ncbi:MAG: hypothetical protein WKF59_09095 [Chitinophagaceae bacterium]